MVATRARSLISSTKVPTAFTTSGAGRELRAPTNWPHLIAAALPDTPHKDSGVGPLYCVSRPDFQRRDTAAVLTDRVDARLAIDHVLQ